MGGKVTRFPGIDSDEDMLQRHHSRPPLGLSSYQYLKGHKQGSPGVARQHCVHDGRSTAKLHSITLVHRSCQHKSAYLYVSAPKPNTPFYAWLQSTLLRAVCASVVLAQLGCPVPAASARLTVVDRIFTRLGAGMSHLFPLLPIVDT